MQNTVVINLTSLKEGSLVDFPSQRKDPLYRFLQT